MKVLAFLGKTARIQSVFNSLSPYEVVSSEAPPHIVTDSIADIPGATTEKLGIDVIRLKIMFGETEFTDGINLDMAGFLARLRVPGQAIPKTAAPGTEVFKTVYSAHPEPILSIHTAPEFSRMFKASIEAAQELHRTDIESIDSQSASMGVGLLAIAAAKWAREGRTSSEIVPRLDDMRSRTYVGALGDTLRYLRESGRINLLEQGLGSMLDLKPMLQIKNGVATKVKAVRTRSQAIPAFVDWIKERQRFEQVAVMHAGCLDDAKIVAAGLQEYVDTEVILTELSPAVTVHIGPNAIGVAFITAES